MKQLTWLVTLMIGHLAWTATAQPFLQPLVTESLAEPYGVAVDLNNNYYLTDSAHNRVLRYNTTSGELTNFAGTGLPGGEDGLGVFATFFNPQGIVYARGGLVVADSGNHRIRFVAMNGSVTTLAGSQFGYADGQGVAARFNSPAGVAADSAGNIYVADQLNNRVRRIDLENNVTTIAAGFLRPSAVTVDDRTGRIYVADTGAHSIRVIEPDGTVQLFAGSGSQFISGKQDSLIAANATFQSPRGLYWVGGATGLLVSDTGNGLVRRVFHNTSNGLDTFSVQTYVGADKGLSAPVGLAMDNLGNFPLIDLGNETLSLIQVTVAQAPVKDPVIGRVILTTNFFGQLRTELVPIVNATFNNDVVVAILAEPGTETFYTHDLEADFPDDPSSRITAPAYENGLLEWTHTIVNPALNGADVTVRAFSSQEGRRPSDVVSARFHFRVANPVIHGRNPGGFTMETATENARLWYTTDGSSPEEAGPTSREYLPDTRLNILNGTNDVVFKVRGFKTGYQPSTEIVRTFFYRDLETSSIGVTKDFVAGIGSTIVVPVEVKLAPEDVLRSLQFRIEVIPENGAPAISTQFRSLNISTNDFILIPGSGTNVHTATVYNEGNSTGLAISFLGSTSGLELRDNGIVALVAVPIPPDAAVGQTYRLSLQQASGTSDGFQNPVALTLFADRTITIENVSYVVGDSAVADWYNAGDFGNGNLNNNDVNNAFHASLGLRTPYPFTDVFDAMDAFPVDSAAAVGGDGQIRFLDWQVILQRSLRLTSDNWVRAWGTGGMRTAVTGSLNSAANLPATSFSNEDEELGNFWVRHATVSASQLENVAPGTTVHVPVSVKVAEGHEIAGMQFRAVVLSDGDAPELSAPVEFVPAADLPTPIAIQGNEQGLPGNEAVGAWSLFQNAFPRALTGERLLGHVKFTVPDNAPAGSSYTVRFINPDGAPDVTTQYDLESFPATVWVGGAAQSAPQRISDEWKLHYFGSVDSPEAHPDADPDLDGIPNWKEFLAGTDPTDPESRLELMRPEPGKGLTLRWQSIPGRRYMIESTSDLASGIWEVVASGLQGDGRVGELAQANSLGARYYRIRLVEE